MYKLKRRYFKSGTYSTLHRHDGSVICSTVECPWVNNTPRKSCVPEGFYHLVPTNSPKYGECYALSAPSLGVGVHEGLRTHCLFHIANAPSELLGCIAPGVAFGYVHNQWGVISSGTAFKSLMKEFGGETIELLIEKA